MDITISGVIGYKVTLHCAHCSTPFLSKHRVEIVGANIDHIRRTIQNDFRQRMPNIPEGWTMNGRTEIVCPTCFGKG